MSGGEGAEVGFDHLVGGFADASGGGEGVESEVAALLGLFVVLLGEDGTDEADYRVAVGKIPTTSVRRRISRLRRSFGLLDQI